MKAAPKLSKAKPKNCALAADELFTVREARLALQKECEKYEAREKELKEFLIDNLPASDAEGVTGKLAHAEIVRKNIPQVKDWDKFYAHVKKTGNFELLQRRLNDGAVKERWEQNKSVPGVEPFPVKSVSLTKKK